MEGRDHSLDQVIESPEDKQLSDTIPQTVVVDIGDLHVDIPVSTTSSMITPKQPKQDDDHLSHNSSLNSTRLLDTSSLTFSTKRTFSEMEIEEMKNVYKKELLETIQTRETMEGSPMVASSGESTSAFTNSLDSYGKILYAQLKRNEEKIDLLSQSNQKLQDMLRKKNEKINTLQQQLSAMVKQIEKYEVALRQRIQSPPIQPSTFNHLQFNPPYPPLFFPALLSQILPSISLQLNQILQQ